MNENTKWLDKIIAEQAAYYGKTVKQFDKFMSDAADYQEFIETTQEQ